MPRSDPADAELARARSRRLRFVGGLLAVVLSLVGLAAFLLYTHRLTPQEQRLLDQAPAATQAAGCTQVETVPAYPNGLDRAHVGGQDLPDMPALSDYPSIPPASGPHGGMTLGAGVYSSAPAMDLAIHSLEHGAVIVWYDPAAVSEPELDLVRRFFEESGAGGHVILAPYDYPEQEEAGRLQDGAVMALAAWHHVQRCRRLSLPVAFSFVEAYRFNLYRWRSYRGDAPEKFAPI